MALNEKIVALLKEKRMTKTQLAKAAGIPYTTLDSMLKRNSDSKRLASVFRMADYLGVSVEELVFEEEGEKSGAFSSSERDLIRKWRKLDARGRGSVSHLIDYELSAQTSQSAKRALPRKLLREIAVYDFPAAAGTALPLLSEDYTTVTRADVREDASFGIRIAGDSMEPVIEDGSIVWVKQQKDLEDREIGIFVLNGEGLCKHLHKVKNGLELLSENPRYAPIRISEHDDLRVIGKVLSSSK